MSWHADGTAREANRDAHDGEVESIVPCSCDEIVSAANGGVIRWSLNTMEPLAVYRFSTADGSALRFAAAAVSPCGATLLATGFDGAVAFRKDDGRELWRQTALGRSEIALGIDGAFVVGSDTALVWLDGKSGEVLHSEDLGGKNCLEHLLPLPGSRAIVAAYRTPQMYLYDLAARQRLAAASLPLRPEKNESCRLAAGGGKLVISRWDYSFDMFDAESLQHCFEVHNASYADPMAVSPDGALVACGENELQLFDAGTFELLACQTLGAKITALHFAGPRHIVAGLGNGQLVSIGVS
jgi:outer membrane protein assembly factor BamB